MVGSLPLPRDTSPEIQARLDEHYRAMTPLQRLHRSLALRAASHQLAMLHLRQQYPEASNLELRLRLALRTLPKDLGIVLARRKGYPHLADELW
jgi:hypothetical protein